MVVQLLGVTCGTSEPSLLPQHALLAIRRLSIPEPLVFTGFVSFLSLFLGSLGKSGYCGEGIPTYERLVSCLVSLVFILVEVQHFKVWR